MSLIIIIILKTKTELNNKNNDSEYDNEEFINNFNFSLFIY